MIKCFMLLMASVIILFSCSSGKEESAKKLVQVEHDTLYQEISYTIQDSSEKISLEVYLSKLNKGVMRYRYKGNTLLKDQIPKLDSLLAKVLNDSLIDFNFTTLFWGRLNNSTNRDFTFAKRLVLFAHKSNAWNNKQGRPNSGNKNDFIKLLKNEFTIELAPLFKKYGYTIENISAEKVLVYPAEKLAFFDDIKTEINAKDKFPFDCQLWFKLSKNQ